MTERSPRTQALTKSLVGLAAASLLVTACGDDEPEAAAPVAAPVEERDALITSQLDGLEVTVTGNVTETIGLDGFQVDKDGLGDESTTLASEEDGLDFDGDYYAGDYDLYDYYGYDYDYYDYDYYTSFDGEYDNFDERAVLVVAPGGTQVAVGDAVQVNGTLRYMDESALESVYDLDLEDDVWGSYENQYVLVADAVNSVAGDRETAMAGGEPSTEASSQGSTSTTAAPDAGDGTTSTTASADDDAATDAGTDAGATGEGTDDDMTDGTSTTEQTDGE